MQREKKETLEPRGLNCKHVLDASLPAGKPASPWHQTQITLTLSSASVEHPDQGATAMGGIYLHKYIRASNAV